MIRGLKFQGPNKYYPAIKVITENIDIKKYFWYVVDEDIVDGLIEKGRYTGAEFEEVIDGNYYAISIYLQSYICEETFRKYNNHDDFIQSKCELIIIIDDNSYIYTLAKDTDIIEIIKRNAEQSGYRNIEYITDENDELDSYFY